MENVSVRLKNVPVRARVGFALAIAESVLVDLVPNTRAHGIARKALAEGWNWEMRGDIAALRIYDKYVDSLALESSRKMSDGENASFGATISAMYYLMWHAFQEDLRIGMVSDGEIPNDMADVGEDVLDETCEYASRSPAYNPSWTESLVDRLAREFHTQETSEIGTPIPRDYFLRACPIT